MSPKTRKNNKLGFGLKRGGMYTFQGYSTLKRGDPVYKASLYRHSTDERALNRIDGSDSIYPDFVNLREPFMATAVKNVKCVNKGNWFPRYSLEVKILQGERIGWVELSYAEKDDFVEWKPEGE